MPDELRNGWSGRWRAQPPAGADAEGPGALGRRSPPWRHRPAGACADAASSPPPAVCAVGARVRRRDAGGDRRAAAARRQRPRTPSRPPSSPSPRRSHPGVVLPRGAIAFSVVAGGRGVARDERRRGAARPPAPQLAVSRAAINVLEGTHHTLTAVATADGARPSSARSPARRWPRPGPRPGSGSRSPSTPVRATACTTCSATAAIGSSSQAHLASWRRAGAGTPGVRVLARTVRVMVHNVIDSATAGVRADAASGTPAAVAFAPYGGLLAFADRSGRVAVVDTLGHGSGICTRDGAPGAPEVAWLRPGQLAVGTRRHAHPLRRRPRGRRRHGGRRAADGDRGRSRRPQDRDRAARRRRAGAGGRGAHAPVQRGVATRCTSIAC